MHHGGSARDTAHGVDHRPARGRLRRLAVLAVAAILAAGLPTGTATAQQDAPVVEAARQISQSPNPARGYVGPQLAVHPNDPSTVAAIAADARGGGCSLFVSRDGGLSWLTTVDNLLPERFDHCIQRTYGRYTSLAFNSEGTLFASFGASSTEENHPNGPATQLLMRTSNLGRTHQISVVAEPGSEQVETSEPGQPDTLPEEHRYGSLAIDPTDPNTVYVGWRRTLGELGYDYENVPDPKTYVAVSTDGGESFSEPVNLTDEASGVEIEGSDYAHLVVGNDGTAYAFTKERPPSPADEDAPRPVSRLFMFTSTDGGESWSGQVLSDNAQDVDTIADAAVDPNTGDLYYVWGERGERPEEGPRLPITAYFRSSSDGGETWNERVPLVDQETAESYDQFFPAIAVAPNGRIDVAWHDFRNDPFFDHTAPEDQRSEGVRFVDIYYSSSEDGGRTFSEPVRVTDRIIDSSYGLTFSNNFLVSPPGLASTDASTYLAWPDTRAGDEVQPAQDVYFTRLRHGAAGTAVATGAGGGSSALEPLPLALGAAVALFAAGMIGYGAVTWRRRRTDPEPARKPAS